MFTTMEIRPNENRFRPIQAERAVMPETPTGGGYPSRDQFNQTFQVMPAVMPEVPTGGGYPSRDQFYSQVIQPTMIEATPAQQNTSYAPSAEKQRVDEIMKRSYTNPSSVTAEDTAVLRRWEEGANARNAQDMQAQMQAFRQQQQLAGGLGGTYGGYQAMPYGGYQPMGGYRMFPF
jgi:hypothetical protein